MTPELKPFAYAWRWKGSPIWKLTLTKKPNHHPDIEIKELFAAPAADDLRAAIIAEGQFLLQRIDEWTGENLTDSNARDWDGHVLPPMERLRDLLERAALRDTQGGAAE